ncbi:acetyl-CoA carboxylase biotin carboxyl carrier protein subunit [Crocinitomix catalasitica]|nr:acetyl-CoA carboxylase biotin carboxyl carrier protein subunit [Crocinitomix catalasitica]
MIYLFHTIGIQESLDKVQIKRIDDGLFEIATPSGNKIIEVLEVDFGGKKMHLRYNHRTYWIAFRDELDLVLEKMGLHDEDENAGLILKAPMPGRILDVLIKEGDSIEEGDSLLVLEAMKMENVLRAESVGVIQKILISKGDNVDKNQLLIEISAS